MAYGAWSGYKETQVWSNVGYKVTVKWEYRQDPVANTTEYAVREIKVYSLKSPYNFYNSNAKAGVATITANRNTQTVDANIPVGGSQTFNVTDDKRVFTHNSDGTVTSEYNIHGYFDSGLSITAAPNMGWQIKDIHGSIPKIDRGAGTTSVSISSKTYNSITLSINSDVLTTVAQYRINGGTAIDFTPPSNTNVTGGGTYSKTFSGLSPNTSYKIEVRHRRNHNQVWSSWASATTTTNKPSPPTIGAPSVSELSYNYAKISIATSTPGAGGSISSYQISSNNSTWTTVAFPYNVTGLSPNTAYTRYVRCIDNYGTPSASKSVTFKTTLPGEPTVSTVDLVSKTYNSATIKMTGTYGAGHPSDINGYYRVKLSTDTTWTRVTNQNAHVISGLSPNTAYTIECQLVDAYGQVSSTKALAVTTNKPNAPTKGKVEVSEITSNSAKFTISGFSFGEGATWGKYQQWSPGEDWQDLGQTTVFTRTGLSPNTTYTVGVKLVDNYGSASEKATVSFTTLSDQAKVKIKVNGVWETGKVWINVSGTWKKAKNVFVKSNNAWKKNKS